MKKTGQIKKTDLFSAEPSSGLKFLGIVENIRYIEMDNPEGGQPRLEYVITGRDFGKVFDMNVYFNPQVNQKTIATLLGAKFLADSADSVKGSDRASLSKFSPDLIMKKLLSFYLGGSLDALNSTNELWYVPKSLVKVFGLRSAQSKTAPSFYDILSQFKIGLHNYDVNQNFKGVTNLPGAALIKALPPTGTVWAILQHMSNAAVNEMYTELVRTKLTNKGKTVTLLLPTLVHRQLPFSNRPGPTSPYTESGINPKFLGTSKTFFINLPRHEILSSDALLAILKLKFK